MAYGSSMIGIAFPEPGVVYDFSNNRKERTHKRDLVLAAVRLQRFPESNETDSGECEYQDIAENKESIYRAVGQEYIEIHGVALPEKKAAIRCSGREDGDAC
jgi:hypothetical protein